MRVELLDKSTIAYFKEQGNQSNISYIHEIDSSTMSIDERGSRMYLATKDRAMSYFMSLWNCRNTPMSPIEEDEPIFEEVPATDPETGETVMQLVQTGTNKKSHTPLNIEADDYKERYEAATGNALNNYVPPLPPNQEPITFVGFKFLEPKATTISVNGPTKAFKGDMITFTPIVYDQFGDIFEKTFPTTQQMKQEGMIIIPVELAGLHTTYQITVEVRPLSELEQLQSLVADLIGGMEV